MRCLPNQANLGSRSRKTLESWQKSQKQPRNRVCGIGRPC